MRSFLAPLLLLALLSVALYLGVERGSERTITVQGIGISADALDWEPGGTRLDARGHVTLTVPNLTRVMVSDGEGQRSWAFGAQSEGSVVAERATVDLTAGLIEAEEGVFTSADSDPLVLAEPVIRIYFRAQEATVPFNEARP
jgi:hypothetical protein